MVYKWYILPIGGLYTTYHPLQEPEKSIESTNGEKGMCILYITVWLNCDRKESLNGSSSLSGLDGLVYIYKNPRQLQAIGGKVFQNCWPSSVRQQGAGERWQQGPWWTKMLINHVVLSFATKWHLKTTGWNKKRQKQKRCSFPEYPWDLGYLPIHEWLTFIRLKKIGKYIRG